MIPRFFFWKGTSELIDGMDWMDWMDWMDSIQMVSLVSLMPDAASKETPANVQNSFWQGASRF